MQTTLRVLVMAGVIGGLGSGAFAQVQEGSDGSAPRQRSLPQGSVTAFTVPQTGRQVDYVHAQAMPLPLGPRRSEAEAQADLINALTEPMTLGEADFEEGGTGTGSITLVRLGVPQGELAAEDEVQPEEFGTSNQPFGTARADLSIATNTAFPYRISGKLFFNVGSNTFVCSASLIKRGVVVTAAHCIADFGKNQFYTNWRFVPGYRNGSAPFGTWTVRTAYVLTSYLMGTDSCAVAGVVCQNDVGVLLLNTTAGAYPGTATGWYGYGWDSFGFTAGGLTHITQTGYPVCLDNGALMERNDSHGFKSASNANNTLIGSLMCGGSSGGPWLVNFGVRPSLTSTTNGTAPNPNVVVGVTSWGFTSTAVKQQGASPFSSTNIVPLVTTACAAVPAACS